MKTPAEARAAWCAALRSGRFRQQTGCLEEDGRQCCLGVACRIAIEDGVPITVIADADGPTKFDGHVDYLPDSVMGWLGLTTPTGEFVDPYVASLVDANDNRSFNFGRIAYLIEDHESELIA